MRRSIVLAVGLLVLLSGCNAVPGGDAGPTTQATTHADGTTGGDPTESTAGDSADATADDRSGADAEETADDATTTESSADPALAPGLSADEVTDAAALAAAHERSLEDRTYSYDRSVRVVAANGTELGRWSQHTQVGEDRLRFNHSQTGSGVSVAGITIDDSRLYTNGSVTFSKASVYRDGYHRESGRGFAATTFSSEQLLADVLNASETSVTPVAPPADTAGVSGDGQWYRVRAAGDGRTLTYQTLNDTTVEVRTSNVTATALVAPAGFVRNLTFEYDFERGNVSGRRTMTVRYSSVGETEVAVPAWVAEAKAVHANRTGDATEESATEEETEKALDGSLAPGLNESGVTDAAALADAHEAVLRNTSYATVSNTTARAPDGTLLAQLDDTTTFGHDPLRYRSESSVEGENPRVIGAFGSDLEVWASENGTWQAIERPNGTEYRKVADRIRLSAADRTNRDALFVLFSTVNTTVADTETRNGTALYRVNSTDVTGPEALASHLRADSVSNVSLSALVDERGLVREYRVEYTATLGGKTSRVERTVRFTALGETTVERPAWVAEASNSTA
jgi:hypothetical protein